MLFICALLTLFCLVDSNITETAVDDLECSRVPPNLACLNSQLAQKCGFADICNRYTKASANKKIEITLLYESLCGGCQGLITGDLYKEVYLKYGDYVDIKLVPYGNAKSDVNVNCARIPPSFWCSNDQLTKTCGFAEVCKRYNQASKNQKVQLTVLYESMCPDCQKFITDTLYRDVYLKFGDFVEIELVPYGNAKNKNGTITCQHGEEECRINKYESCALHYISEPVPFIYCLENQLRMGSTLDQGAPKCYETLHIQPHISDQVIHCANGKYGDKMQQEDAKKTDNIWPDKHEYVPWLVFNGVSLKNAQFFIKNLPSAICEWYVGDRPPSACRGIGNTRRKNLNNVCMND